MRATLLCLASRESAPYYCILLAKIAECLTLTPRPNKDSDVAAMLNDLVVWAEALQGLRERRAKA